MQRVLEIDLARLAAVPGSAPRARPWADPDPAVERVGSAGGSALAVALVWRAVADAAIPAVARATDSGAEPAARVAPLVFACGPAVRAGLPTAARASVASLSPLTGGYTEGLVGGDLVRRLARTCDALVLRGRAPENSVLVLDADGAARLDDGSALALLPVRATLRALRERHGDAALVAIGPAGERGLPFASLASGGEPPSFVGRGGLGAVFGALGLKAFVVRGAPVPPAPDALVAPLRALLARSPRLRARSEGGSLEIAAARAAEGDRDAPRWEHAERGARTERKGCSGCPTPCGVVFERVAPGAEPEERPQGAHYGALAPFGPALGLARVEDGLALLARCDELGLDAKEAGAVLALLDRARELGRAPGPRAAGDVAALGRELDRLVARDTEPSARPASDPELSALLARGAAAVARAFGLEDEAPIARGQAVRVEAALESRLGVLASARGGDPMRTLAFLAGDTPSAAVLERLFGPWRRTGDAARDAGLAVWWSENLANALDTSGFCAFSAAGLLADGVATLDELARAVLPGLEARSGPASMARNEPASMALNAPASMALNAPGRELLALGASVALLQHALSAGLAPADDRTPAGEHAPTGEHAPMDGRAPTDEPATADRSTLAAGSAPPAFAAEPAFRARWARKLALPGGAWSAYVARRGLDPRGRVEPAAWAALGTHALLERGSEDSDTPHDRAAEPAGVPATGRLSVRAQGPLGRLLAGRARFETELPATAGRVLAALAAAAPRAAPFLVADGRPVAIVVRGGRRLREDELVRDGDELDLVVVLSGG
ncbi:MAG: hypothetical protein IPJ77_09145 [Planctomycetes bacterium]|nr:hypothetical protein [Planctomycetota bacterium]